MRPHQRGKLEKIGTFLVEAMAKLAITYLSKTFTSEMPKCLSASAVVRPAGPAPTTATFLGGPAGAFDEARTRNIAVPLPLCRDKSFVCHVVCRSAPDNCCCCRRAEEPKPIAAADLGAQHEEGACVIIIAFVVVVLRCRVRNNTCTWVVGRAVWVSVAQGRATEVL